MNPLVSILLCLGAISVPVVGYFYPYWRSTQGKPLSDGQLYAVRALGIGIMLVVFILYQLMI